MKKNLIILSLLMLLLNLRSLGQTANLEWAHTIGGTGDSEAESTVVDFMGNVYVVGNFRGVIDFDPGVATLNITAQGGSDIFIQKLDPNGNLLWIQTLGGTDSDHVSSITTDDLGNIYLTGSYRASVDFDPGTGTAIETATGGTNDADGFVLKLNTLGQFVWVQTFGSATSLDGSQSIVFDSNGFVIITGSFGGTMYFGTTVDSLTSLGGRNVFILKLEASTGGDIWAKLIESSAGTVNVRGAVDASGNVYIAGVYADTADFDPSPMVVQRISGGENDVFILKLDANGNYVWVKTLDGTGFSILGNSSEMIYDIEIDPFGNVIIAGYHDQTVDFDPGPNVVSVTPQSVVSIFVLKLDVNGNYMWVKSFDDPSFGVGQPSTVATDLLGNIYVFGYYWGTLNFDFGVGLAKHTSNGESDLFLTKLDVQGNYLWSKTMGGVGHEYGRYVDVDTLNNIYITGTFEGSGDFDPNAGVTTLTSIAYWDCFTAKLNQSMGLGGRTVQPFFDLNCYPNPTEDKLQVDLGIIGAVDLSILDQLGRTLYEQKVDASSVVLDFSKFPVGIYYLSVRNKELSQLKKIIKD